MAQGFVVGGPAQESGQSPGFSTSTGEGTNRALQIQAESIKEGNNALLKALDSTIKFTDEAFRKGAEEDAKASVDEAQGDVRKSFFEREVQTQAVQTLPESTPKELQDKEREMARIKAAYDNGSLTSTHYWSRLDATARSLRARYPGYKDEIDATISKYSGGKPANQVVSEILSTIEAENKKQAKDEWSELWKIGKHVPEIATADARGQKLSVPEMRRAISGWEANESIRKKASAELEFASSKFGLETRVSDEGRKEITRTATSVVNLETTEVVNKVLAPLGPVLEQLTLEQAKGGKPSTQTMQKLGETVGKIQTGAAQEVEALLSRKRPGGKTLYEMVPDQAEIDRLRNGAKERISLIVDAYGKGDMALLSRLKQFNDIAAQGGEAEMRSIEFFNRLGAAKKVLPEADLSQIVGMKSVLRNENEIAINTFFKVATGEKDVETNTLGGLINKMSRPDVTGIQRQTAIDKAVSMITADQVTPETKEKFYNFLFGDNKPGSDIMSKIPPGTQREEFFSKMVNPKGLEAIKKLEADKPGTMEKFRQWVEHNGTVHVLELMNTVNKKNEEKGSHLIVYSKEDQLFRSVPNPSYKRLEGVSIPTDGDAGIRASVFAANKAVASLVPTFQTLYPKRDVTQQLFNFLAKANMTTIDTPKQ